MRVAADELRAELAGETRDVRRQPQHQLHQRLRRRLRVLRLRAGQALARRLPRRPRTTSRRGSQEAVDYGATEICMQGGIHPDYTLEDYGRWLRLVKEVAPQIHLHAYSPMEVHYMCERSGKSPGGGVRLPARVRPRLDARAPRPRCSTTASATRISPNKLPVDRWVEIIEACHRSGLRSTSTVMFGHIEEPWELAAPHARRPRAAGADRRDHRVRAAAASSPSTRCSGRTHGVEEISREENLKHTAAFRLALGRTIPNLQASWVKMGLDAATESLRWGVNDLGGTLMEENISRMAGSQHGVRLEPAELIDAARGGGPRAGPAHHAVRDRRDVLSAAPERGTSHRVRALARYGAVNRSLDALIPSSRRSPAGQHGVVARSQLLAAGITAGQINARLERRRLHQPSPRRLPRRPRSAAPTTALEMAALLACGPRSVLSHRSAAALWDLLPYPALERRAA